MVHTTRCPYYMRHGILCNRVSMPAQITLSDSEDEEASQLDSQEEAERDGVVPTPAPQLPQLSSALLPPPSQVSPLLSMPALQTCQVPQPPNMAGTAHDAVNVNCERGRGGKGGVGGGGGVL